jgi:hypothetical protein
MTRFEYFMRSHLSRAKVESIILNTLSTVSSNQKLGSAATTSEISIVVSGLAKLFLGELIEICKFSSSNTSLQVM